MARMHARRKGKAGSTHMVDRTEHPTWSSLKPREIESRILELAKSGNSSAQIGSMLRDQYAVPNIKLATGKKLCRILDENNMLTEIPEDLKNLISRALQIRDHLEINKKDVQNKRNLQLTESKIRRLVKYYHSRNKLPKGWKYSPKQARLMFE
ncbi:MAG: 30S ribosomal protein S15 [Thermoplasmatota archaeon]